MNKPLGQEYYNTNMLHGDELAHERIRAKTGTDKVLDFMREHKDSRFTPHQVSDSTHMLLGSVRRAMTMLTQRGLLIRCQDKVRERYGSLNSVWQYYRSS